MLDFRAGNDTRVVALFEAWALTVLMLTNVQPEAK
jgi:hypothetical protein